MTTAAHTTASYLTAGDHVRYCGTAHAVREVTRLRRLMELRLACAARPDCGCSPVTVVVGAGQGVEVVLGRGNEPRSEATNATPALDLKN